MKVKLKKLKKRPAARVKPKKKFKKPDIDHKRFIRIEEYEPMLRSELGDETYETILGIVTNFLQCKTCLEVLPLDHFAKCKSNRNRLNKYSDCKACSSQKYKETRLLSGKL